MDVGQGSSDGFADQGRGGTDAQRGGGQADDHRNGRDTDNGLSVPQQAYWEGSSLAIGVGQTRSSVHQNAVSPVELVTGLDVGQGGGDRLTHQSCGWTDTQGGGGQAHDDRNRRDTSNGLSTSQQLHGKGSSLAVGMRQVRCGWHSDTVTPVELVAWLDVGQGSGDGFADQGSRGTDAQRGGGQADDDRNRRDTDNELSIPQQPHWEGSGLAVSMRQVRCGWYGDTVTPVELVTGLDVGQGSGDGFADQGRGGADSQCGSGQADDHRNGRSVAFVNQN